MRVTSEVSKTPQNQRRMLCETAGMGNWH